MSTPSPLLIPKCHIKKQAAPQPQAETEGNNANHHLTRKENGGRHGQPRRGRTARPSGADGAAEGRPPKCILEMSPAELQALWKCNDAIAKRNVERLSAMDLRRRLTPAILSYEGIQYQYMAPRVMETAQLDYLQEHLRILSGFYGLLRPLDGVTPYRLENAF